MKIEEIISKWAEHPLIENHTESDRKNLSVLLENASNNEKSDLDNKFNIDIVSRVYNKLICKKIISFQPQVESKENYVYFFQNKYNEENTLIDMQVQSKKIKFTDNNFKTSYNQKIFDPSESLYDYEVKSSYMDVMSSEVAWEYDRRIISQLSNQPGTSSSWNFNTALGDTIREKYESLYVKVVEISNVIHRKTLRGGANFIVTSPEVASVFETATAGFSPSHHYTDFSSTMGIQYVGSVNNRWKLYKDPLFSTSRMFIGYKGDSMIDSGFVLAPSQLAYVNEGNYYGRYYSDFMGDGQKLYATIDIENFLI